MSPKSAFTPLRLGQQQTLVLFPARAAPHPACAAALMQLFQGLKDVGQIRVGLVKIGAENEEVPEALEKESDPHSVVLKFGTLRLCGARDELRVRQAPENMAQLRCRAALQRAQGLEPRGRR